MFGNSCVAVGSLETRHIERMYMTVGSGPKIFPSLILKLEVVPPEIETWFRNNSTDFSCFLFCSWPDHVISSSLLYMLVCLRVLCQDLISVAVQFLGSVESLQINFMY